MKLWLMNLVLYPRLLGTELPQAVHADFPQEVVSPELTSLATLPNAAPMQRSLVNPFPPLPLAI